MSKKSITVILAVALLGFGSLAFAHWNGGYGYPGWMHGGYGMYGMHGGYYGDQGYGYQGNLNEDQINALQKEQDAFLKETEATRQDLYAKQLAIESELAKSNPDASKVDALQKEISNLQAQLDQMRVDHLIKMKKIDPDASRGFAAMGPMMGYGSQYPGSCWQ